MRGGSERLRRTNLDTLTIASVRQVINEGHIELLKVSTETYEDLKELE